MSVPCATTDCNNYAVWKCEWPGAGPVHYCTICYAKAERIATVMGVKLLPERLPGPSELMMLIYRFIQLDAPNEDKIGALSGLLVILTKNAGRDENDLKEIMEFTWRLNQN